MERKSMCPWQNKKEKGMEKRENLGRGKREDVRGKR